MLCKLIKYAIECVLQFELFGICIEDLFVECPGVV